MSAQSPEQAPQAEGLVAKFDSLFNMIVAEVQGLEEQQLDFQSDRWGWSQWSIRMQMGHIAAAIYRWLFKRWEPSLLFPAGVPEPYRAVATSGLEDRVGGQFAQGDAEALLASVQQAIDLAREVLARQSTTFLRSRETAVELSADWELMSKAHPTGLARDSHGPAIWRITLEATFRHLYYEAITHLYNIQRLKRAQGLAARVQLPLEGYWALDGWDRSEP